MSAPSATAEQPRLPAVSSVYRVRAGVELKEFFRQREAVVFTLLFPVLLLLALGAGLNYRIGSGVTFPQFFMAGVITAGIVGASLQNMAISIAGERSDGTLKHLAGTPMPKNAYFVGKVVQVLAVTVATVVLLVVVGLAVFRIHLPTGGKWLTFAWVSILGAAACTLLGIVVSTLARNSRSASATVTPIALALEFISGVFIPFDRFPHWVQVVASIFPVRWLAQGLRSVFLPHALSAREPAGSWELGRVAVVLAAWCVIGLFLAVRTFRWQERGAD